MKRLIVLIFTVIIGIIGCGKPPKDVARKIVLGYFGAREELILEDIKYLNAYSKDGGYTVNIQAGDALCEMPMIKGDKEWLAKGISCNGQFLSPEKFKERKKIRISEGIKKDIASESAQFPKTLDNGIRVEKITFDGTRFSVVATSPLKASEFTDKKKKDVTAEIIGIKCKNPTARDGMTVGISQGMDFTSIDGKPVLSITVTDKDCLINESLQYQMDNLKRF